MPNKNTIYVSLTKIASFLRLYIQRHYTESHFRIQVAYIADAAPALSSEPTTFMNTDKVKPSVQLGDRDKKESPYHGSSNAQSQTLLSALHNLIVPLVKNVVPNVRAECYDGPEAERFVVALQEYVFAIIEKVESDDHGGATKTVDLTECNLDVAEVTVHSAKDDEREGSERQSHVASLVEQGISPAVIRELNDHRISSLFKSLTYLRDQVFNDFPIRLLYFEQAPNSGILNISLLNKTEVYTWLAKQFASIYSSTEEESTIQRQQLKDVARYAILSHTWSRSRSGEISYDDWHKGHIDLMHSGYKKLVQFCRAALEDHGINLAWMDTVCIDKSSSSELDESIRSMYKWYENSSICIVYLAESDDLSNVAKDSWFTRGWTLQELIAPRELKFYGRTWNMLTKSPNDKGDNDVQIQVQKATSITKKEIENSEPQNIRISRKMQWAAYRQVTRSEDIAYSLMGLFDVNMSTAYGEGGRRAFTRLIKEILSTCKLGVLDIFNWGGQYMSKASSLLPNSPKAYITANKHLNTLPTPLEPLTLTHMGLRVPLLILPLTCKVSSTVMEYIPLGDYFATHSEHPTRTEGLILPIITGGQSTNFSCNVLDRKAFGPMPKVSYHRYAVGILNCGGDERNIKIPIGCFAIFIKYISNNTTLTPDMKAILEEYGPHTFRRDDLVYHGMQLLTIFCYIFISVRNTTQSTYDIRVLESGTVVEGTKCKGVEKDGGVGGNIYLV
ncbi:hypothetical protein BDN70DRAFT_923071 [Pholiota conissans]|uniref:Heterokaryon incompatibility domain-containing protein n=1 Tax=Pholiota conissans TaxID=109636 RepID=A0A9P5YX26_9AGAR|nr:hypothetical protein BDN70DRAFT_923071 [Pholiota conissans]